MKRWVSALVFVVGGVLAFPLHASFVSSFTGNSGMFGGATNGWVNFAVYINPAGNNWITDLGVNLGPGSSVTGLESKVFFFQIVNDSGSDIQEFTVDADPGHLWNGIGFLTSTSGAVVFNEAVDGPVIGGAGNNNTLGAPAGAGSTTTGASLAAPPFSASTTARIPVGVSLLGGGATASFDYSGVANRIAGTGGFSTVLVVTNTSAGGAGSIYLADNNGGLDSIPGANPVVDLPVANPEPGTLALLSVGLVAGGVYRWRRRSKGSKESADDRKT